jgi:phosphotransferase system enzyme I (PtsI)
MGFVPAEHELSGRPASAGIFIGAVVRLESSAVPHENSGDPAREETALNGAIARAIDDITRLTHAANEETAAILGFQIALLEDDELRKPALFEIGKGGGADVAWKKALDAEIIGYELSDDEYFRARAADLKDVRDRVIRNLSGASATRQGGAIVMGADIPPTVFLEADWTKGGAVILSEGSPTSHVAMLARARGVPMVTGLGAALPENLTEAIVDGEKGLVIANPAPATKAQWQKKVEELAAIRAEQQRHATEPAQLRDGSPIELLINVAGVDELESLDPAFCDGIGLMRSEFLFRDGAPLPDEEQQFTAYRRFLEWAGTKPVTIRTLDIGGDKPVKGLTPAGEKNPFLGQRGIRLMLARPDVFRVQLRALARAAVHGELKIMLPMVSHPSEISRTAALLDDCLAELAAEGKPARRPPLGIMVEVPAAAIAPELFREAAFFSIGSNDLTQYVMAAARDETSVSILGDPSHPAVQRTIACVAGFGASNGVPVSICGDMAGEPRHLAFLISAGLTTLSVAPSALAAVKATLRTLERNGHAAAA